MKYLDSLNYLGSVPGLDTIKELLRRLGNPQKNLRVIHIAGTNGKGSVGAFLDRILSEADYVTGRYSSPAVINPLEIIRKSEKNISKTDFSKIITHIKTVCKSMVMDGFNHPTRFEVETACAFDYFNKKNTDIVIVECGMGGLCDATNVFDRVLCSVITSIDLDHMAFLGKTLEEIAEQKAGIIKPNCDVITNNHNEKVLCVLRKKADKLNAPLSVTAKTKDAEYDRDNFKLNFSYKNYKKITPGIAGSYQIENVALVIETIEALKRKGYIFTEKMIIKGIRTTKWEGRFELIKKKPVFVVDGAHNPAAARVLAESIRNYIGKKKIFLMIGIFKDKDVCGILNEIIPLVSEAVVVETPGNQRAMDCTQLSAIISDKYLVKSKSMKDIPQAVKYCLDNATDDDAIISCGSLSNIKAIKDEVKQYDNRQS